MASSRGEQRLHVPHPARVTGLGCCDGLRKDAAARRRNSSRENARRAETDNDLFIDCLGMWKADMASSKSDGSLPTRDGKLEFWGDNRVSGYLFFKYPGTMMATVDFESMGNWSAHHEPGEHGHCALKLEWDLNVMHDDDDEPEFDYKAMEFVTQGHVHTILWAGLVFNHVSTTQSHLLGNSPGKSVKGKQYIRAV